MSGMSVRILDGGAGWECLMMRAWSQWGKETCTYPGKNLPDRTSSIEFLRLKHSWLRTFAFILSEVRSHWRVLSEGTIIGLCYNLRYCVENSSDPWRLKYTWSLKVAVDLAAFLQIFLHSALPFLCVCAQSLIMLLGPPKPLDLKGWSCVCNSACGGQGRGEPGLRP